MLRKDRVTNSSAHLAHSQARVHRLMLQLTKEPNFCKPTIDNVNEKEN